MIETYLRRNRRILALALVGAALACLIPGAVSAASKTVSAAKQEQTQQPGRLVIARAANLGSMIVGVSIDGKEVMKINFGGAYDAPLAAGPHVISVVPVGSRERPAATQTRLTVQPGKTYKFTAKRSDVTVVLK